MGEAAKRWWRAPAAGMSSLALAVAVLAYGGFGGPPSAEATTAAGTAAGTANPIEREVAMIGSPFGTTAVAIAPPATLRSMPVYWIAESRRSFALYREFRAVPNKGGPVSSAVSAMTRLKPLDPDYMTPWRPASRVSASQRGSAITVNVSSDAFANRNVGSALAHLAAQQLVYTATAAAYWAGTPASSVKILVNGRAYDAWGAVRLGKPMRRAPLAAVQAHTWVTSPQQGEVRRTGIVTFRGFGTSYEANFLWKVRRSTGAVVARGFTMGGDGVGRFGEFTFKAKLKSGAYIVEVSGEDPSGGTEGPGAAVDDKGFTVR